MRRTHLYRVGLTSILFLLVNSFSFSQNGVLKGKVKYRNEVLQSASITLGNITILTDLYGEFSFSIDSGNYKLTITHAGYKKIEQAIVVEAGSTKNLDFNMQPNEQLGDIVVLGSRSPVPRSNLNTAVPVDAFSSSQLQQTGQTNLMQMLNFSAPSLNASLPIATEPVTLRGLNPDHVLILLNSTRYNNSAYIHPGIPRGQLGRGSAANDMNTIPFSAVEKVEILRDGASAQYGSDAIAGVINIQLKESTGKTSVNLHLGQQYKGDGEKINLGIYHGIDLNKKGFLSFSGDLQHRKPAFRGGEYLGTVYYDTTKKTTHQKDSLLALDNQKITERGFDRMNAGTAGSTELTSFGILVNGAFQVNEKTELFWTGALNNRNLTFINQRILPRNSAMVNSEIFPDGFKARVKPTTWNVSGIAGARGGKTLHWEYSSAYGMNNMRYNSYNTNNPSQQYSLGKNAPTNFYTGTLIYQQLTNAIHFTKSISRAEDKLRIIGLSWGAELRFENFKMKAGEEASWKNYDSTLKKSAGVTASQATVSPDDATNKGRNIMCAYIELDADLNDRFLLNLASRYEHYSDFGGNLAGKLATRYKLFDGISLRASVSNGFRAPSMQQRYFSAITSGVRITDGVRSGTRRGIFNNEHKVTSLFGVPSLEAEKSLSLSGGLTSTISRHIYMTIDAYWIQIKNRIVLSGAFDREENPEVDRLLKDSSRGDYSNIGQVSFFSNAINTRTTGIDAVIHGKWNINKTQLIAIVSANFTKTRLFGEIKTAANLSPTTENKNTLFDDEQRSDVERGQPQSKIILSLNYKKEKFGFILRNTRFGKTAYHSTDSPWEYYSPKILTDISISYAPKSWFTITAGANNVFDVYPDPIANYANTGEGRLIYDLEVSQFGFMGGYYYINMSFNF